MTKWILAMPVLALSLPCAYAQDQNHVQLVAEHNDLMAAKTRMSESRIVGGEWVTDPTNDNKYQKNVQFIVGLSTEATTISYCTGVLFSDRYIVTSAHCAGDAQKGYKPVAADKISAVIKPIRTPSGKIDFEYNDFRPMKSAIYFDTGWQRNPSGMVVNKVSHNDVVLLELQTPIADKTIGLKLSDIDTKDPMVQSRIQFYGLGTSYDHLWGDFKKIEMQIKANGDGGCNSYTSPMINEENVCFQSINPPYIDGPRDGDSGGAVMPYYDRKITGIYSGGDNVLGNFEIDYFFNFNQEVKDWLALYIR